MFLVRFSPDRHYGRYRLEEEKGSTCEHTHEDHLLQLIRAVTYWLRAFLVPFSRVRLYCFGGGGERRERGISESIFIEVPSHT